MLVLGFAFAASWTVVTAMAVRLPRLLEAAVVCRAACALTNTVSPTANVRFCISQSQGGVSVLRRHGGQPMVAAFGCPWVWVPRPLVS
jgi:hypothetical protein